MNDSQPPSPRARMQELLAIPDRNRTDEEWDELNELEIALASGNRPGAPDPQSRMTHQRQNNGGSGRQQQPGGGRPQGRNPNSPNGPNSSNNPNNPNNPGKKFHKRPGKRRGGGGGGGGGMAGGGGGPQQPPQ